MKPKAARLELLSLLNEWDPLGVADEVDDEYDCLVWPLLAKLSAGAGRTPIREVLDHELEDHFGLSPERHNTAELAERLVNWWLESDRHLG